LTNQLLTLEELDKPNQKVSNKLTPVSEKEAKQPRNVIMHSVGRRLSNMAMSAGIKPVINKHSHQMDEFLKELSQTPSPFTSPSLLNHFY